MHNLPFGQLLNMHADPQKNDGMCTYLKQNALTSAGRSTCLQNPWFCLVLFCKSLFTVYVKLLSAPHTWWSCRCDLVLPQESLYVLFYFLEKTKQIPIIFSAGKLPLSVTAGLEFCILCMKMKVPVCVCNAADTVECISLHSSCDICKMFNIIKMHFVCYFVLAWWSRFT